MIRDRIVCGVNDNRIQRLLLQQPELTYDKAKEIAQSLEAASKDAQKLLNPTNTRPSQPIRYHNVHPPRRHPKPTVIPPHSQKQQSHPSSCCGSSHSRSACKFKDATCRNCGKRGHIAKVCRSRTTERKPSHQSTHNTTFSTLDTTPEEENYLSPTLVTKRSPASQEGTYNMFTLPS